MARSPEPAGIHPDRFVPVIANLEELERVLPRLRACLRRACGEFRRITGMTAVVSMLRVARGDAFPPPVHPECAGPAREDPTATCDAEWRIHVREARRSRRVHAHRCRLGLRCACIPIHLGDTLVGLAKVVVNDGVPAPTFSAAIGTLALAVRSGCQETLVAIMTDELQRLQERLDGMARLRTAGAAVRDARSRPGADPHALVDRALDHLHRHFREPSINLGSVAAALDCNGNYLTQLFTRRIGQRMHGYIVQLRVDHACEQLLRTRHPIKRIAYESGFRHPAALGRAFRRHVGISPSDYRRVFTGGRGRGVAGT